MSAPLSGSRWTVLVVDGDRNLRKITRVILEWAGATVLEVGSGAAAIAAMEHAPFDAVCLALSLPDASGLALLPELKRLQPDAGVIAMSGATDADAMVEAVQAGATAYLTKPFSRDDLRGAVSAILSRRRMRRAAAELLGADPGGSDGSDGPGLTTRSRACAKLYAIARRAAVDGCTILLRGETGTGKNVMAESLWRLSTRAHKPKVDVHCPALFGNAMAASELFGHRRGAFTGAVADARGKLEEAEGGTAFLDEVGDLQFDVQAQWLSFLQDGTYWRLGDTTKRRADVRILAATNRDLEADVIAGRFREDLFQRLNVVTLTLLPLRDRREDVMPLARAELLRLAGIKGGECLELSPAAEALFEEYAWPGNVRELHHALARAVVMHMGERLEPEDFAFARGPVAAAAAGKGARKGAGKEEEKGKGAAGRRVQVGDLVSLEKIEREHIACVVAATGTLAEAARVLGINARTLERKRQAYELR